MSETKAFVHPTAIVEGEVDLGEGTKIWHFSKLLGPVSIGRDCSLGQNVVVERHVQIGNQVKIQNNVSVYSGVILEDDVFCGPSMVFTNVSVPRSGYPERANTFRREFVKVLRLAPMQPSFAVSPLVNMP